MRGWFIAIAIVCASATFLGLFSAFDSLLGYDGFANKLFEFFKCGSVCAWMTIIGSALLAGFFSWLASKSQNRK